MGRHNPTVSVIIPVFNAEKWLGQCLDSLEGQTFVDWEAICVDDGSTDSSADILARYSACDERFKIVTQSNRGTSVARKTAVSAAAGEWCLFLDPDDWLELDALDKLIPVMDLTSAEIVTYGMRVHAERTSVERKVAGLEQRYNPKAGILDRDAFFMAVYVTHEIPGHLIGKAVRTETCRKALLDMSDRRILFQEDLCALFRMTAESRMAQVVEEQYYNYRVGQGISYREYLSKEEYFGTFSKFEELNDLGMLCAQRFSSDTPAVRALHGLEQRMALASVSAALERLERVEDGSEGVRRLRETCSPEVVSDACAQWFRLKGTQLADVARTYGLSDILGDVAIRQLDYVWRGHNSRLRNHDNDIAVLRRELQDLKHCLFSREKTCFRRIADAAARFRSRFFSHDDKI